MTLSPLTEQHLALIRRWAAEGASFAEIAGRLSVNLKDLGKWSKTDPRLIEALAAGKEKRQEKGDQNRRKEIDQGVGEHKLKFFNPTQAELDEVKELCKLNWPESRIAQRFKVSESLWAQAKRAHPALVEAIANGRELAGGKSMLDKVRGWLPTPTELEQVTFHASKGMTPPQISVELGLPATTLEYRMHEIPELLMAYENGLAKAEQFVSSRLWGLIEAGDKIAIMYWLKARRREYWSDRQQTAAEAVEKNRKHAKLFIPGELDDKAFARRAEKHKLKAINGGKK